LFSIIYNLALISVFSDFNISRTSTYFLLSLFASMQLYLDSIVANGAKSKSSGFIPVSILAPVFNAVIRSLCLSS